MYFTFKAQRGLELIKRKNLILFVIFIAIFFVILIAYFGLRLASAISIYLWSFASGSWVLSMR
ncbi:hypothetical protein CK477_11765 [Enterobacter cloacae]|nr:hypothetical protein CK477_11765 [Enterobacter cloacae]